MNLMNDLKIIRESKEIQKISNSKKGSKREIKNEMKQKRNQKAKTKGKK